MALHDVTWNDEMLADLSDHWLNDEKSAAEIASLLNKKYDKTITRNQVMTRVRRLGLRRDPVQMSEEELQARAARKQARAERILKGDYADDRYTEWQKRKEAVRASKEVPESDDTNFKHSKEYHMPWKERLMWYFLTFALLAFLYWSAGIILESLL